MITSEQIVAGLIDIPLQEDRIDRLMQAFPNLTREQLDALASYDPTPHKRFLVWLAKLLARDQRIGGPPDGVGGSVIASYLSDFQKFTAMPDFADKDFTRFDNWEDLEDAVNAYEGKQHEKNVGSGKIINTFGPLSLVKIEGVNNYQTLVWYSSNNVHNPVPPCNNEGKEGQTNWCTRFPDRSQGYLKQGPFYIILYNGKTYMALHPASYQWKHVDQHRSQPAARDAAEISELIQPIANELYAVNFAGDLQPLFGMIPLADGSTVESLDWAYTTGKKIPNNLTVNRKFILRGSDITELAPGLKVGEWLDIRETGIKSLGDAKATTLAVDKDFPSGEILRLVYRMRLPQMKDTFIAQRTTNWVDRKGVRHAAVTPEEAEDAWPKMQDELRNFYVRLLNPSTEKEMTMVSSLYKEVLKEH